MAVLWTSNDYVVVCIGLVYSQCILDLSHPVHVFKEYRTLQPRTVAVVSS